MPEYRDLLLRLRKGQFIRQINRETGISRNTIRPFYALAKAKGWLNPDFPLPTESDIQNLFINNKETKLETCHPLDKYKIQIGLWKSNRVSRRVIFLKIKKTYPGITESTLRRYIAKHFPEYRQPVMTRQHIKGDVMEVDFGFLGRVWNTVLGKTCTAWLFSARLRYSRKAYRRVVYNQEQGTFFSCHMEAFEYFGGVPRLVVCDNLKAAIIKAALFNPLANRAYRDLAIHYGFHIDPNPPRQPRLKGGVENDVQFVKNNFLQLFKLDQKDLGKTRIFSDELEDALAKWSDEYANTREVGGTGRCVPDMFAEEKPVLSALPDRRWEIASYATYILPSDYRICFQKGFYSASYRLIGEPILVKGTSTEVSIFHKEQLHYIHPRVQIPFEFQCIDEHRPPSHLAELIQNRSYVLTRAAFIGESTKLCVEQLFSDKALDALRPCRAIVRLSEKFGVKRLEAACRRALYYQDVSHQYIKNILMRRLDEIDIAIQSDKHGQLEFTECNFRFVRSSAEIGAALKIAND
jgi:transposase